MTQVQVEEILIPNEHQSAENVKTFGIPSQVPDHIESSLAPYLLESQRSFELLSYAPSSDDSKSGIFVKSISIDKGSQVVEVLFIADCKSVPVRVLDLSESAELGNTLSIWKPISHETNILTMDHAGNELWQVYQFQSSKFQSENAALTRLTNDESRYTDVIYHPKRKLLAYASPKVSAKKTDVFIKDLSKSWDQGIESRLVDEPLSWKPVEWSSDGAQLLVSRTTSTSIQELFIVQVLDDLSQAIPKPVTLPGTSQSTILDATFSKSDPSILYIITSSYSDFNSLCQLNLATGELVHLTTPLVDSSLFPIPWDISHVSATTQWVVFVANEDGTSSLHVLDPITFKHKTVPLVGLPPGIIRTLKMNSSGTHASIQFDSSITASSVYEINLETLAITAYEFSISSHSQTPKVIPSLVRIQAFDSLQIPAFYYPPPTSTKPCPVVIYIHGGPATQYKPGYQPTNHPLSFQYLVNNLNVAVLAPNVRGSAGYGRKYMEADDGILRHDSIKDIGSCIDWIKNNPNLDPSRICVMGRSCKSLFLIPNN